MNTATGTAQQRASQRANVWDILTGCSTVLIAITGVLALIFAYLQIRESRQQAKVTQLESLIQEFDRSPLIEKRKALASQRIDQQKHTMIDLDSENPPAEAYDVLNFFENIGLLTRKGFLDKNDVSEEFGDWMFAYYSDLRPFLDSEQKNDQNAYSNFSSLMQELYEMNKTRRGTTDHPSPAELYDWYSTELSPIPSHKHSSMNTSKP